MSVATETRTEKDWRSGLSTEHVTIPGKMPAGIIEPTRYRGLKVDIDAGPGCRASAFVCESGAHVELESDLHVNVQISGSLEQIRFVLNTWAAQLDELERQARSHA